VAQIVTIEKGQHLTMLVEYVDEAPSKNPAWESRWKVTGNVGGPGGSAVSTYIGNKAMVQQLGRIGLESPDQLVTKTYSFERTAEGYLNIIKPGGKTKTPHMPIETESAPVRTVESSDDTVQMTPEDLRQAKRKRIAEDVLWAFAEADSMVAAALANREVEYTAEAMRSVVALAATLHISYKETR
jgi:hypothetical protein